MRQRSKSEKFAMIRAARDLIDIPQPNVAVERALESAYEMGYRSAGILAWAARQILTNTSDGDCA